MDGDKSNRNWMGGAAHANLAGNLDYNVVALEESNDIVRISELPN
jgi:hypothetical protein